MKISSSSHNTPKFLLLQCQEESGMPTTFCDQTPSPKLCQNKSSTSDLLTTLDYRLIQSVEGGGTIQANLVVAQDGSGDFTRVTRAIRAFANRRIGTERYVIYVKSGVYKENIVITQSMTNLTLIGDGIDATVVTSDKNYNEGYTTGNTATVQIWASGFIAMGITFENTAGPTKQQAIALLSSSDLSAFYKCSFKGYQDTLCLLQYRQFYRECDIYGTIDFIFGDATAVLQNCNIYVRNPLPGQQNTITAQGRTDARSTTGFVMHKSSVSPAPDLALASGQVSTFLGRPWKDYSRVVFIKCYFDNLIDPSGWMPFEGNYAFDKVYYAEYICTGNGANTGGRVTWPGYHILTTNEEVEQFSVGSIATLLFSRSLFCSNIPFCDESPFPEVCNSIIVPKFGSHESQIKASMSQAKATWMDCLELYQDAVHHLNVSMTHMNKTDVENWLNSALVNHQVCQNGLKDSNLSLHLKNLLFVLQKFFKSPVDLLAENKHTVNNLSMTVDHRLFQLAEGGTITQVDLVVAQDGSGDFSTVAEAIEASEKRRTGTNRFVIHVKSGVYVENVVIKSSMTNLTLIGDGIDVTTITNNKSINGGYTTFDSATFQILGSGFVAVGITFENSAGPDGQAVALLSASDFSVFYKCSFKGYQDTLCLLQNHQFYRECDIYGTVDFIFGDATAVLQNCNIYLRKPLLGQENTITAQGRTDPMSPTGFIIHNSYVTVTPELTQGDGLGPVRTYLGRPWREYSRVVYLKCFIDSLVDPQGWLPFRGSSGFDTVYYGEHMNSGQGANTANRVTWQGLHVLTSGEEVEQFSVGSFLAGDSWIPQTGVPYLSGI
ncbi:hypothetical protein LXL04_026034 [Taraxacum kok-saghyz]